MATTIIGCIGGIIGCVMGVLGLVFSRKDKSNKDTKDGSYHLGQIDTRLKNIEEVLEKIQNKLDIQEEEIDTKIEKAMENHIKIYHKGE